MHESLRSNAIDVHAEPGSVVSITAHGAQALSWVCRGRQRIFLGRKASYTRGRAIRGGIPVIFPQFGTHGPGPRHGFARYQPWQRQKPGPEDPPGVARFMLTDSADSRQAWAHRFEAVADFKVSPSSLRVRLAIRNTDAAPFEFTAALHTYLRVPDVTRAVVTGLHGLQYMDATQGGAIADQDSPDVRFDGEVDRIFIDAKRPVFMSCDREVLAVYQTGFRDVVIWNPGEQVASTIVDLAPGEFREFVCIEAAVVREPVVLEPGSTWCGTQTLVVPEIHAAADARIG